ncbi:hypothetical protein RQP46_008237 [Phenoliferia psychrophenolica]
MLAILSLCTVASLVSTAHAIATPVDVGTAKQFVILAQSGISTTPDSNITGHMGLSPAPSSYITGFSMAMAQAGDNSLSNQVLGNIFAANYGFATPGKLTQATNDARTGYNTAMAQPNPDFFNYQAGGLDTLTLPPGIYKYTTDVNIKGPVTLAGGPDDVWVFQISGRLTQAVASFVTMSGGAKSTNVYWATAQSTYLGPASKNVGTFMSQTNIILGTGAEVLGQLLAQTAVVLQQATVSSPNDGSSFQNYAPVEAQPSSSQAPYVLSSTVAASSASPAAVSSAAAPAPASSSAAAAQATPAPESADQSPANGNTQGSDANAQGSNPNAQAAPGNEAAASPSPAANGSDNGRGAPVYGGYSSASATSSA